MNRMLIGTVAVILLLPGLLYLGGTIFTKKQISKEVKNLRTSTRDISANIYDEDLLVGLPLPVQRYFRYVLSEGQPYVSAVYMEHDGQFKTALDKEWIDIKGKQYFSADEPGFLWVGKTSLFSVRDMYISQKGRIKVKLLNIFKLVDGEGYKYDQGELLRWLGESVWFPTNLLPGPRLRWSAIDNETANLTFKHEGQEVSYEVSFDALGSIKQLQTRRYMGDAGLETWIGRVSDYQRVNGMLIPMRIEAIWKIAGEEHSYARFNIRNIYHNYLIEGANQ